MAKPPTLRSLARRLRLSIATVSHALHGNEHVSARTRARVERTARQVGYRLNPLLGAALSAVRSARHQQFRGTLALVDIIEENHPRFATFRREICAGAEERARELGFTTERFQLGHGASEVPARRLNSVLNARGIVGVLLMPFNRAQDLSAFDFSRLSAVQMDHSLARPQLHTILPDHHFAMMRALDRLTALGYTRIGLCLERQRDARIRYKWSAAYHTFFREYARSPGVPVLIDARLERPAFVAWFHEHRPDVVVGHVQETTRWLDSLGARVPQEVGFLNLNHNERTGPCAGLDLQPRRLGAVGIETIVGMLHRGEFGVPAEPHTIALQAKWVDGPTLRTG